MQASPKPDLFGRSTTKRWWEFGKKKCPACGMYFTKSIAPLPGVCTFCGLKAAYEDLGLGPEDEKLHPEMRRIFAAMEALGVLDKAKHEKALARLRNAGG